MHKETIEQIARLRSRTAESETSYNKLKEQLAANDNECTTSQLRLGTNFLSEPTSLVMLKGSLFAPSRRKKLRLARWRRRLIFTNAKYMLERVTVSTIQAFEDVVKKYGPNVRTLG